MVWFSKGKLVADETRDPEENNIKFPRETRRKKMG
jgi:hypothetical protein